MEADPSAFIFGNYHILEHAMKYDNEKAKISRATAIENIAKCTEVTPEDKKTLIQLCYNLTPMECRTKLSEERAQKADEAMKEAKIKFDEHVASIQYDRAMYTELVTDVKWLIEMNVFIACAVASQQAEEISKEIKMDS